MMNTVDIKNFNDKIGTRKLILVNTFFQIMVAVQIRREMFPEDEFDCIIANETPGLDAIFENHVMDEVFSHVFYYEKETCIGWKRHLGLVKPTWMLNEVIPGIVDWNYEDIFFWNPNDLFYFIYTERCHKNSHFHLYCDGMAQYILTGLEPRMVDPPNPFKGIEGTIWQKCYGNPGIRGTIEDYYIFAPEYVVLELDNQPVKIPSIRKNDEVLVDLFNRIFQYDTSKSIPQKIVLIDQLPEMMGYVEEHAAMLDILEKFKEDVVIKPHPRLPLSYYEKWDLEILRDNFSWDMYCFNNPLDTKLFINHSSGAVFFPYILYDADMMVIATTALCKNEKVCKPVFDVLCPTLQKAGKELYYPETLEEFEENVKSCLQKLKDNSLK